MIEMRMHIHSSTDIGTKYDGTKTIDLNNFLLGFKMMGINNKID